MRAVRLILLTIALVALVGAYAPGSRQLYRTEWGSNPAANHVALRFDSGELRFIINREFIEEDDDGVKVDFNARLFPGVRYRRHKAGIEPVLHYDHGAFGTSLEYSGPLISYTCVSVSCIWIAVLTGIYPIMFALRETVRRRRRRGEILCRLCGYDLRGNASGVCPECGAAMAGNEPSIAARPSSSV
ncbi:MAG TPA: hypothetical protein P5081_03140 [Phycisphaerae bacterium]|nr:hypothetical protein [Phycisphaerae bacterium]HRW51853.1 hypothetical protein [Phycisphaerae bacterium]